MRDQLQPTFSTCIDLPHQNTFYKNNHLTQPHSSPNRILTTVAYTCFPNESMSQASTPIYSQSVSDDRTVPLACITHTRTDFHTCPHYPRNEQPNYT